MATDVDVVVRKSTRRALRPGAAFALQVSMILSFLASSMAPMPLYATYQELWGFSPAVVTVVFAIYAVTVLLALITVGSLSDFIGRKPVLIAALIAQAAAMIMFLTASGLTSLIVARGLQGLSTGAALGALGAGLLDLNREKGTTANAVGAMSGTALGALASGLLVTFLPAPTHLVFAALLVVFALQFVGTLMMRETGPRRPGALASLRPQASVPARARAAFMLAVPVFIATWALMAFYGSLGPAVTRQVAGSSSALLGGMTLFLMAGAGALAVLVTREASPQRLQVFGAVTLIAGVAFTHVAMAVGSIVLLLVAITISGVGFGTAFQGAFRSVLPLAPEHQRAGFLSAIFVVCYLAMGVPAVIAGILATRGEIITTAHEFGVVVMVLAAVPLISTLGRAVFARAD